MGPVGWVMLMPMIQRLMAAACAVWPSWPNLLAHRFAAIAGRVRSRGAAGYTRVERRDKNRAEEH